MKYVKFYPVDDTTGVSTLLQATSAGARIPDIPGLTNLCVDFECNWYYGHASDDFVADPNNNIYELTLEEYTAELTQKIEFLKKDTIEVLYEEEKILRDTQLSSYHETATTAGVQKYNEAVTFTDTGVASSALTKEAEKRGVTVAQLCEKIIRKYGEFRDIDSSISGLRGKLSDRVKSFTLDQDDPWTSHQVWEEKEETLIESRVSTAENGIPPGDVGTPEVVRYYSPNLELRYRWMDHLDKNPVGVAST
jgi:hypothetical protein